MKRKLFFILILFCLLPVSGCVQKNCEDENVQSFFTGEIKESGEDYIICEVNDSGNSGISEGAYVYVSRNNVVSSDGFPVLRQENMQGLFTAAVLWKHIL